MSQDQKMLEAAGWRLIHKSKQGMHWIIDWRCPYTREIFRQGVAVDIERCRKRVRRIIAEAEKCSTYPPHALQKLRTLSRAAGIGPDLVKIWECDHIRWMQLNNYTSTVKRKSPCPT